MHRSPLIRDEIGHFGSVDENPSLFAALVDEMRETSLLPLTETVGSILDKGLDGQLISGQIGQSNLEEDGVGDWKINESGGMRENE